MRDNDLYERFECIHPPRHHKLYELEVEAALFYPKALIRRWGRIGTRHSRTRRGLYALPEELQKAVEAVRRIRMRHGYHLVSPIGMMGARRVSLTPEPAHHVPRASINPLDSVSRTHHFTGQYPIVKTEYYRLGAVGDSPFMSVRQIMP